MREKNQQGERAKKHRKSMNGRAEKKESEARGK